MSKVRYTHQRSSEFLTDIQRLDADEIAAYTVVRALVIFHGGPIDDDGEWLKGVTGIRDVRRWRRARGRLIELGKFTESAGKLSCPTAEAELAEAVKRMDNSHKAAEASVEARVEARKHGRKSRRSPSERPRKSRRSPPERPSNVNGSSTDPPANGASETNNNKDLDQATASDTAQANKNKNQEHINKRREEGTNDGERPLAAGARRTAFMDALRPEVPPDAHDRSPFARYRGDDRAEEPIFVGSASLAP